MFLVNTTEHVTYRTVAWGSNQQLLQMILHPDKTHPPGRGWGAGGWGLKGLVSACLPRNSICISVSGYQGIRVSVDLGYGWNLIDGIVII